MEQPIITLRPTEPADLDFFFRFQLDEEANYLAAFTAKDRNDKQAYLDKYSKHLADPLIRMQTILAGGIIAGSIASFFIQGDREITYWLDKSFWGKGIATAAVQQFMAAEATRPVFARIAFNNIGSQKVLEKCGFIKSGTDKGFANARQMEIEEWIYRLG